MNLLIGILLATVKTDSVYVILGGTSAVNSFQYYDSNVSNVFSYDFKNSSWVLAENPMAGVEGNGSSIWPYLGNSLSNDYENIYFFNCARENAILTDWNFNGKYYSTAVNCFYLASNFSLKKRINYNVLWQEGPQDNYYSYDSNYFINLIQRFVLISGPSTDWFLSVFTYGNNYSYRNNKLYDIIYLIDNNINIYEGAQIDNLCYNTIDYSFTTLVSISDLWYKSIINKNRDVNIYSMYNLCIIQPDFNGILFVTSIIFIFISLTCGLLYGFRYYRRRKYYQQLQN